MTGYMNAAVFLVGAVMNMVVTFRVVQLGYHNNPDRSKREAVGVKAPPFTLIGLLVGFYFLNWIPPVPLSLKFGGIYHEVKKTGDRFELSFERQWYQIWKRSDDIFSANEPIYYFGMARPGYPQKMRGVRRQCATDVPPTRHASSP